MSLKITNESNMDLMSRYPDNYFDLAICDPEYGLNADKPSVKNSSVKQKNGTVIPIKNNAYKHKNWDSKPAGKEYFTELKRVSKHQIIFGVNYYDFDLRGGRIVWDKLNGDCDQFGCEIAYNSLNVRTDIVYFLWSGMMQGVYCGKDVRRALSQQGNKQLNEKRIHPTQKPVPLYKWILENYAKPGFKILDTNLGSGSLAVACDDYGFDLIACELDSDTYNSAMLRIKQHTSQQRLFQSA
jgi:site-specific DNA-methyltransferase (adenine-specific)